MWKINLIYWCLNLFSPRIILNKFGFIYGLAVLLMAKGGEDIYKCLQPLNLRAIIQKQI